MADRPAGVGCSRLVEIAIMEAGEGINAMFELERDSPHIYYLSYILGRNNGGSPSQWTQKQTILSLSSGSTFVGSAGRHLFIEHNGATGQLFDAGCFARGMKTFQLQRLCVSENGISQPRAYSNFPPSLSSPRLSTGIEEEMLGQGLELLRTEEPKNGNHSDSTADDVDAGGQAGASRNLEMAAIEVVLQNKYKLPTGWSV